MSPDLWGGQTSIAQVCSCPQEGESSPREQPAERLLSSPPLPPHHHRNHHHHHPHQCPTPMQRHFFVSDRNWRRSSLEGWLHYPSLTAGSSGDSTLSGSAGFCNMAIASSTGVAFSADAAPMPPVVAGEGCVCALAAASLDASSSAEPELLCTFGAFVDDSSAFSACLWLTSGELGPQLLRRVAGLLLGMKSCPNSAPAAPGPVAPADGAASGSRTRFVVSQCPSRHRVTVSE
mmetsp:Transcript_58380/g.110063  ORF Transcript_58380/g.110063 Transcript_58380/m.110063 type:complete len:233 (-) Transcript_58380:910-1608(-)